MQACNSQLHYVNNVSPATAKDTQCYTGKFIFQKCVAVFLGMMLVVSCIQTSG